MSGTTFMGFWVVAHECGHFAFSDNKLFGDVIGLFVHSCMLVPYYAWQHSHAVHHSKTNHVDDGESFVPMKKHEPAAKTWFNLVNHTSEEFYSYLIILIYFTIGWPVYLLFGTSGGPSRGFTSHFIIPNKLFQSKEKVVKVIISHFGCAIFLLVLYIWIQKTSLFHVMIVYGGPYFITNCYFVSITWTQHTDQAIAHLDNSTWDWLTGAIGAFDRNWPLWIDYLNKEIGTTHVTHHLFSDIPYYNAREANIYVKEVIGKDYLHDERDITKVIQDTSKLMVVSDEKEKGVWEYTNDYTT